MKSRILLVQNSFTNPGFIKRKLKENWKVRSSTINRLLNNSRKIGKLRPKPSTGWGYAMKNWD